MYIKSYIQSHCIIWLEQVLHVWCVILQLILSGVAFKLSQKLDYAKSPKKCSSKWLVCVILLSLFVRESLTISASSILTLDHQMHATDKNKSTLHTCLCVAKKLTYCMQTKLAKPILHAVINTFFMPPSEYINKLPKSMWWCF